MFRPIFSCYNKSRDNSKNSLYKDNVKILDSIMSNDSIDSLEKS